VQTITYLVPFGGLIRSLHYWSGQLLLAMVGVHLLRVFFTGAYAGRRRFNNLLGMALLVGAVLLNFTGYMLRWDQGIQWALVVGTNLLKTIPVMGDAVYAWTTGGEELGAATVIRFYAWHVFGLLLPFAVVGIWHLFRVRRDGGIAVPPPALRKDHERISRGELVRRELLGALIAAAVLLLLAVIRPAQLEAPIADMQAVTEDALAPWFFLWVQELLTWGDPFVLGVLVPIALVVLLSAIPYVARRSDQAELGQWFPRSGRGVQALVGLLTVSVIVLSVLALLRTP
jgi:quinol-cytochrome oxidoreductase complex cytochrome b subunit